MTNRASTASERRPLALDPATSAARRQLLSHRNLHRNRALGTELHNLVGGRDFSRKQVGWAHHLQCHFSRPAWAKFEIVGLSYGDRKLSRTEFPLSWWKIRAVFRDRKPHGRIPCNL